MSVVREMRAQMQQPASRSGDGLFAVALGGILLLGGAGVAYMLLSPAVETQPQPVAGASPQVTIPQVTTPQVTATIPPKVAANAGKRIGRREMSPIAATCFEQGKLSVVSLMDQLSGDPGAPVKRTPEQLRQAVHGAFQMMDAFAGMDRQMAVASFLTGRKPPRDDGLDNSASMLADAVECTAVRPPAVLCNPDNRAAAVSYLNHYVPLAHKSAEAFDRLPPMKRFEKQGQYKPDQIRVVMSALANHARAGSITLADLGSSVPEKLKAVFDANPPQQDICATTRS